MGATFSADEYAYDSEHSDPHETARPRRGEEEEYITAATRVGADYNARASCSARSLGALSDRTLDDVASFSSRVAIGAPIHTWARKGELDKLAEKVEMEPGLLVSVDAKNRMTPLMWAARHNREDVVAYISAKLQENDNRLLILLPRQDKYGMNALHHAIMKQAKKPLIEPKWSRNSETREKQRARYKKLSTAYDAVPDKDVNLEIVRLLLQLGENPNQRYNTAGLDRDPIGAAIRNPKAGAAVLRLLYASGVRPELRHFSYLKNAPAKALVLEETIMDSEVGETAGIFAVIKTGRLVLVEMVIEKGRSVIGKMPYDMERAGFTTLMKAAKHTVGGRIMRALLDAARAEIHRAAMQDADDDTQIATIQMHAEEVFLAFVNKQTRVTGWPDKFVRTVDQSGEGWRNSALHIAARHGSLEQVSLLLDAGADRTLKNWHKETPIDIARRGMRKAAKKRDATQFVAFEDIVQLLEEQMDIE